jgi:DNA-binding response OmpR family regulator
MKLLVIEDNPRLAGRLRQQLSKWYIVDIANSGDRGLQHIASCPYDCILLDLGLPDAPGLDICKQIRTITKEVPILVVTGIDTTASRVSLLENGADDYITKPFDFLELKARINTLLRRRARADDTPLIVVGDLTIDPARRTVLRGSIPVTLRRKEFDILEYLALNPGRVMSRENIINHAWSSTSSSWVGSVDVHIKQLRDKIDKPFPFPLIKTVYGLGYTLNARERATERKVPA